MKSLLDLIEEQGIELTPIAKDIYRGFCPLHPDREGGKPQFTYYAASESFFCYRCNIGGDNVRFLAEIEGIPYNEAKQRLLGTLAEQFQELNDITDNLDATVESEFNLKLNFALRPKFRELFYKYPEKSEEILKMLHELDTELKNKINLETMDRLFENFKKFSDQIVAQRGGNVV